MNKKLRYRELAESYKLSLEDANQRADLNLKAWCDLRDRYATLQRQVKRMAEDNAIRVEVVAHLLQAMQKERDAVERQKVELERHAARVRESLQRILDKGESFAGWLAQPEMSELIDAIRETE